MQLPAFLFMFIASISFSPKNIVITPAELNGTWFPVKQELGGIVLPAKAYEKQILIISDSTYMFTAESVDKGELKYENGKMDIYGKEGVNEGKHFPAIYKFENGELTICYDLSGDNYPNGFITLDNPTFFLSVFKKQPVK